jgi:hypothetical protein
MKSMKGMKLFGRASLLILHVLPVLHGKNIQQLSKKTARKASEEIDAYLGLS